MSLLHKGAVFGACTALTLCLGIGGAELYSRAHPVERIIERHTVERIEQEKPHVIVRHRAARAVGAKHHRPASRPVRRLPGDDIANELNRSLISFELGYCEKGRCTTVTDDTGICPPLSIQVGRRCVWPQ